MDGPRIALICSAIIGCRVEPAGSPIPAWHASCISEPKRALRRCGLCDEATSATTRVRGRMMACTGCLTVQTDFPPESTRIP